MVGELALPNVPEPLVDHVPAPEFVEVALIATGVTSHVEYGPPAMEVGACWIVITALDIALPRHGAVAVAVKVTVTLPALMSVALGV